MNNQEKSSLSQAASTAQTIHGAIKTGKDISAAAKGAAMGGPYGAAAGAVLYAAQHGKKFLAAAAVLLMLPVLFVLMLPSLIFGVLTSSGSAGQPILNDNAAIVQNTNDIAFAVNQVLGEGIADGATEVVYFNQLDERWANKPYGTDNIGGYGCGPTSMSIEAVGPVHHTE